MPSSISPDGARSEIIENSLVAGNPVKNSSKLKALRSYLVYSDSNSEFASSAITASKPVYTDSSSVPQTGEFPFAVPADVTSVGTTAAVLKFTGNSTLSGTNDMGTTLVAGAAVTTFTKTGFIRVQITDSNGNVTDGFHYIQLGSLS